MAEFERDRATSSLLAGDRQPPTPLLQMQGISKSFFGVPALVDVDLDARAGEVHAVMGENGAGKSTLMKILAGALQPDAGTIRLDGEVVHFSHPRQAQQHGVSIIYQEFNLLPDRTVAQNIFLGREPRRGPFVDAGAMEAATVALLAELGMERSIASQSLVRDLSVAQQQTVEIAKALSFAAKILIMDEPTAALSPQEADALFAQVRLLQRRGLAVLYISHRLQEVFDLAQRITVLKDGRLVATLDAATTRPDELVRMMVGRDLGHLYPPRAAAAELGAVRLRVRRGGGGRLRDIDLAVRAGEIVGLAGLEGAGRTELARAIFGDAPFTRGVVELDGAPIRIRSPRQAIRAGIGLLTEDRKAEGLILTESVRDNTLLALRSLRGRVGSQDDATRLVLDLARRVDLRAASLEQEVRYLSGGNQQKVVLAKWLATRARVLIFDEPTRGIDVGAKAGIHELMRELARAGAAILMISSDLPEIVGMSDRVVVMRDGAIAGELPAGASEAGVMLLATGQAPGEVAA
ncbi:MAG: sugar ABC transporter ATP-binding protein [Thermomicrobiales bacterium]|nr:sugar ABC transporter ATP-binding protein [Thermomicrobiales bacterium]